MLTLTVPTDINSRLLTYLEVPVERMAFLIASPDEASQVWTVVDELLLVDGVDYAYQGIHGMELADDVRPRVLTWANRPHVALVEVHSHGQFSFPTSFSATDLDGLNEVVPQMLWRLRGRPYAALVLGRDDLDALSWCQPGQAASVPVSVTLGDRTLTPTGIALNGLRERTTQ